MSFDFNQFAAQAGDLPAILDSVEQSLSIDTATQFVSTGRVFSAVARRVLDPAAGHRGGGVALFVLQTQPTVESDTNFFDRRDLLVRTPGYGSFVILFAILDMLDHFSRVSQRYAPPTPFPSTYTRARVHARTRRATRRVYWVTWYLCLLGAN